MKPWHTGGEAVKNYLKLLRVKHYIKNLLCFFPLFFSNQIGDPRLFVQCSLGFLEFSLVCSAIYIINDIRDIARDRAHPTKRNRPLASGAVSKKQAYTLVGFLLAAAAAVICFEAHPLAPTVCVVIYVIVNLIYSFGGKNQPVLDIILLSVGYPLRVFFGGFLIQTNVSSWLFLTVVCVSLYLAIGKRYGELTGLQQNRETVGATRPVLQRYSAEYLGSQMYLFLGLSIVFYALWAIEKSEALVYSTPIVLCIIMRYNFTISGKGSGDPVEMIFSDKLLIALILVFASVVTCILYL